MKRISEILVEKEIKEKSFNSLVQNADGKFFEM